MKRRVTVHALTGCSLVIAALFSPAAAGSYKPRWFCSPLIFNQNGRPFSEEFSQDKLNDWIMTAGHSGVGLHERILCLDQPLPREGKPKDVLRVIRETAAGPDTLWTVLGRQDPEHQERSWLCVVEGAVVPDSVLVILGDGSRFMQPVERKRK